MSTIRVDKKKLRNALNDFVSAMYDNLKYSPYGSETCYRGEFSGDVDDIVGAFVEEKEDGSDNSP